jgi:hypothetical protein
VAAFAVTAVIVTLNVYLLTTALIHVLRRLGRYGRFMANDAGPADADMGVADQVAISAGPPSRGAGRLGPEVVASRVFLFLSSYAPLFAILAIRFQGTVLRSVCGALAGVGLLYLLIAVVVIKPLSQGRDYNLTKVEDASGEVAGYLATYILPFVTIPSPSGADIAGYCIFAGVVAVIFVRSDLATINPTLYLMGLLVAVVEFNGTKRHLVCRRLPGVGTIKAVKVAGLLIQKEQR